MINITPNDGQQTTQVPVDKMKILEEIITEYIDNGDAFTAFDVSWEAHNRGVVDRHRDMRDDIHDLVDTITDLKLTNEGVLTHRTLIDVGAQELPWLYFPDGFDPADYVGKSRLKLDKDSKPNHTIGDQMILYIGVKDRLYIPMTMCVKLGLNEGDDVFVAPTNGKVYVAANGQIGTVTASLMQTFVVAKGGGFKVSRSCLEQAGFDLAGTPKFNLQFIDDSGLGKYLEITLA